MSSPLKVRQLTVRIGPALIIDRLDLSVAPAAKVCLLGPSGSGKSMTAAAIMGTLPPAARAEGVLRIAGHEVLGLPCGRRPPAARPAPIFQESFAALNPVVRIGTQVAAALRARRALRGRRLRAATVELLGAVGFPDPAGAARRCPAQLSGGQRQRVACAIALAVEAPLIVADEPTTALDVVAQAQLLQLLGAATHRPRRAGVLLITHDLLAASTWAEVVYVLHGGRLVESGAMADVLEAPRHPVTRRLVAAARVIDAGLGGHPSRPGGTAARVILP